MKLYSYNYVKILINKLFIALLTIFCLTNCTWDYDWDWFGPNNNGDGEEANFVQLTIDNNSQIIGGIRSIVIGNNTYQIAYNNQVLYYNNTGSTTNFNKSNLGDSIITPPILSPSNISSYYDQDHNLRLLFMNNSRTVYSCGDFNSSSISCIANPNLPNLPGLPDIITGNNNYQYAITKDNKTNIYLAISQNNYTQIPNPQNFNEYNSDDLTSFTSISSDINGNLYALVTYGDSTANQKTYLATYHPDNQTWHKILNSANIMQPQQKLAANKQGIVFFISNSSATCDQGKEKIPIYYVKNDSTQLVYAIINNNCSYNIGVNSINIDSDNNIYLGLANNTVFYGKFDT